MTRAGWHVAVDGAQHGPLTVEEIRARGALPANALVWTEGMADWQPVGATPLASLLSGGPPPLSGAPPVPMGGAAPANVGFADAIRICFSKYVDFNGRASRPEFWWFMLFNLIVSLLTSWIDYIGPLVALAFLLPTIAVAVRRLHDTDRSGWWYLLIFVPLVGAIVLIVFWCQRGTPGRNRFG